jgi:tetratricopeptide (TPR) repeat protein
MCEGRAVLSSHDLPEGDPSRLDRLLGFLATDPKNLNLLADAANTALDESNLTAAESLIDRYSTLEPLTPSLINTAGIVALRQNRLTDAEKNFLALRADGHDDPGVRFNLAWIYARQLRHQDVLALLDDEVLGLAPRAAALKVQALHHLGLIDEALEAGKAMIDRFPNNGHLLGALSCAAMDADDLALARQYADQAKGGADALTTLGLIALNDDDPARSLALFDQALFEHPDAPRAWLGRGLGLIATGQVPESIAALKRGAEIFGDHLGSWIAVGWTQFIAKDLKAARATFEHALSLDNNFAESHGALAVLDVAEGNLEGAKRRADIALRLDRECFGGMLARLLLHQAGGRPEAAQRVWDRAMQLPSGPDGKTLAQAMVGLGLNSARPGRNNT